MIDKITKILDTFDSNINDLQEKISDFYIIDKFLVDVFVTNDYGNNEFLQSKNFEERKIIYRYFNDYLEYIEKNIDIDLMDLDIRFFSTENNSGPISVLTSPITEKFNFEKYINTLEYFKEYILENSIKLNCFLVFVFTIKIFSKEPKAVILQYRLLLSDYLF